MAVAKKKIKKKSNFLGFRLSEETIENLELIAKQRGKTRGIVAKDAIDQWINLEFFNQTNEMITISKTFFIQLLNLLNEELTYSLSEELADLFGDLMKFSVTKPMDKKSLDDYTKFSVDFFGNLGLKWFNTIEIKTQNDHIVIRGLHDLNEKFSLLFIQFYKHLLSNHFEFDFSEIREELSSNLVYLEFKLRYQPST